MYYVYVLRSIKDGSFYKGRTNDLSRRLLEHNRGETCSNRGKRPFQLIYVELCDSLEEAKYLESYLKSGFGREIIKEIYADVAEWYTR